jgi:hypothetical protein
MAAMHCSKLTRKSGTASDNQQKVAKTHPTSPNIFDLKQQQGQNEILYTDTDDKTRWQQSQSGSWWMQRV